MAPAAEELRAVERPCEECGGRVVAGLEPFGRDLGEQSTGPSSEWSEWCTTPSCPSNFAVRGFQRVGVNDHLCLTCQAHVQTPFPEVVEHRRAHVQLQSGNGPGA